MALQSPIPPIPNQWADAREHRFRLARVVNQILDGRNNSAGEFDLSGATSTVVPDRRLSAFSVVQLMPRDATAGTRLSTFYVVTATHEMTVHHGSGSGGSVRYAICA